MRIGFDAKRAFFNRSGLGNYSRWCIDALTKFHPEQEYFLYKLKEDKGIEFESIKHAQTVMPDSFLHKTFRNYWRTKGVTKEIKKNNLDIYHGLSHELPIGIGKTNTKSVVTMHDAIFMRFPHLYDASYRSIFKRKYKHALKIADGIIAISKQSKDDIVEFFGTDPDRIKIIYQGCNPIFYDSASIEEIDKIKRKYHLPDEFILYVGTIEPRKNLLGIFEALVKSNIDLPVVAVGRPTQYLSKIKKFVTDNNIEDKAIFLHNVETPELPAIYQMAKLFVYPSLFEGFGIPILEALNSGTPVITTKGSCFPEVGGDAARYSEYGNTEELGDLMKSILNDSNLQKAMIEEGKKQALNFREEEVAQNLISYYKEVLSQ
ncbi:glycosyltransferase family 4 protein [Carboxylicivirga caseinilyticus]|uniref:glycosyltransferase family 4 protein n=1 Tax=Carboxylicivirga caseinilyticus TaxID=3417572 RepID=UPI003D341D5E|nr:glycosyltransferase family 4 protein [Marinilabiliaceae bacterium A049]